MSRELDKLTLNSVDDGVTVQYELVDSKARSSITSVERELKSSIDSVAAKASKDTQDASSALSARIKNITISSESITNEVLDARTSGVTGSTGYSLKDRIDSDVNKVADDASKGLDSLSTSVVGQVNRVNDRISSNASQLNSIVGSVGDTGKTVYELNRIVQSLLRLVADGLEIGPSNSNTALKMGTDRMSFINNGNEVMYITGNRLFINSTQVMQSLRVGQYMWFTRENGNMGLKWVNE